MNFDRQEYLDLKHKLDLNWFFCQLLYRDPWKAEQEFASRLVIKDGKLVGVCNR